MFKLDLITNLFLW